MSRIAVVDHVAVANDPDDGPMPLACHPVHHVSFTPLSETYPRCDARQRGACHPTPHRSTSVLHKDATINAHGEMLLIPPRVWRAVVSELKQKQGAAPTDISLDHCDRPSRLARESTDHSGQLMMGGKGPASMADMEANDHMDEGRAIECTGDADLDFARGTIRANRLRWRWQGSYRNMPPTRRSGRWPKRLWRRRKPGFNGCKSGRPTAALRTFIPKPKGNWAIQDRSVASNKSGFAD